MEEFGIGKQPVTRPTSYPRGNWLPQGQPVTPGATGLNLNPGNAYLAAKLIPIAFVECTYKRYNMYVRTERRRQWLQAISPFVLIAS